MTSDGDRDAHRDADLSADPGRDPALQPEPVQEPDSDRQAEVKLLPSDPRDMTPPAVAWADTILASIRTIPRAELPAPSRTSLISVVWTLAAAADWTATIPGDFAAAVLAREAGVGARVWQKRTAWLRQHDFLLHGRRGYLDGWQLTTPPGDV